MVAYAFAFPLRVAQAVLAVIILGLTAYVVNQWNAGWWSPSQANFLLFCSVWTLVAIAYLVLAPIRFAVAAHKFGILAAEFITMVFWFAGFIAFAVLISDIGCHYYSVCRASQAAVVLAAFEWLLFAATTIMAALHCWRTRGSSSTKHDPNVEIHTASGSHTGNMV